MAFGVLSRYGSRQVQGRVPRAPNRAKWSLRKSASLKLSRVPPPSLSWATGPVKTASLREQILGSPFEMKCFAGVSRQKFPRSPASRSLSTGPNLDGHDPVLISLRHLLALRECMGEKDPALFNQKFQVERLKSPEGVMYNKGIRVFPDEGFSLSHVRTNFPTLHLQRERQTVSDTKRLISNLAVQLRLEVYGPSLTYPVNGGKIHQGPYANISLSDRSSIPTVVELSWQKSSTKGQRLYMDFRCRPGSSTTRRELEQAILQVVGE